MRSGPCAPWVTSSDVKKTPWVVGAIAQAEGKASYSSTDIDALCAQAATAASEILYEMSGRQYTGICGPVTVRPLSRPIDSDSRGIASTGYFNAWGSGAVSYGFGSTGIVSHFGHSDPRSVELGAFPVNSIDEVKIDGVVIPADEYLLVDGKTLVRMQVDANTSPTQRFGWPTSQRLDLPDTEPGTFSVTFHFGLAPPASGILAASKLAQHLVLPQLGDSTKYPQRVTSMQRQGVSSMTVDVMDIVKTGRTGIYEVDIFLRSVNPRQATRKSAVFSPDVGRPRRYPS